MLKKKYDVIIAGAGIPGSYLAFRLSSAGFSVCLIDKDSIMNLGRDWEISIEKNIFNKIGIKLPPKKALELYPERTSFYPPDKKNSITIENHNSSVINIRHKKLTMYFFKKAIKTKTIFLPHNRVIDVIIENGMVKGVIVEKRLLFLKHRQKIYASITVDATGVRAELRKKLPDSFNIQKEINPNNFASAFQEIRETNHTEINKLISIGKYELGHCYTTLGKFHAYNLFHLRKDYKIDLIFGTKFEKGKPLAEDLARKYVREHGFIKKRIFGGGRFIPIRRGLNNFVAPGFALLGDAACQVIPTMGSGTATSLYAAEILTNVITTCLNTKDYSMEYLWEYNYKYNTKRGSILAGYDIVRRFLQQLSENDINIIFSSGIINDKDFVKTFNSEEVHYNFSRIVDKVVKVIASPGIAPIAIKTLSMFNISKNAVELYKNYPKIYSEKVFKEWTEKENEIFSKYDIKEKV